MEFDLNKIKEVNKTEWRGDYNRKFTDEQLIAALNSGKFTSNAAIARYFEVSKTAVYNRIKKLKEKGIIKGE